MGSTPAQEKPPSREWILCSSYREPGLSRTSYSRLPQHRGHRAQQSQEFQCPPRKEGEKAIIGIDFSDCVTPSQWWSLAWPFHLLTAGWFLPWFSDFIFSLTLHGNLPFVPLFPVPLQYTKPEEWVFSGFCGDLSSRCQPEAKASTLPTLLFYWMMSSHSCWMMSGPCEARRAWGPTLGLALRSQQRGVPQLMLSPHLSTSWCPLTLSDKKCPRTGYNQHRGQAVLPAVSPCTVSELKQRLQVPCRF